MVNLGIYKKRSGVPVLSEKDIDVLGEKLVADFCPDALKEPQALDMDSFAQNYLGMEQDYQYLSHYGVYYYPDFYAHEAELNWLSGEFPLSIETIREMVLDRCDPPDGYDVMTYKFFQGKPTLVLHDGDTIDLGDRTIRVLHTPGHSPGHMCFFEAERGYLFTGDLVYKDTLFAYYSSTDPKAYLKSLKNCSSSGPQSVSSTSYA